MLSIWLPFDGNLKNQGLLETIITVGENIEFVNGKIGKCISGTSSTDSEVTISSSVLADMVGKGSKYTVALWIKKLSGNDTAIYFGELVDLRYRYWENGGAGYVLLNDGRGYIFGPSDDITYYQDWHHIAITVDNTGESTVYHHYFDGVEMEQKYRLDTGQSLGDNFIFYTNNFQFNDFRFYSDEILSTKQIKKLAQGLVLRVPLTAEGYSYASIPQSGLEIAHDISGFQHNGIRSGATFSNSAPRLSVSTEFDGSTNIIQFDNLNLTPILSTAWTICFWVYPTDTSGESYFFSSYNSSGSAFRIQRTTSSQVSVSFYGRVISQGAIYPEDNEWSFMAFTFDGSNFCLYKNGISVSPTTITPDTSQWPTVTNYSIGRDQNTGNNAYDGLMSDFRIYATALSADDVMSIYNGNIL